MSKSKDTIENKTLSIDALRAHPSNYNEHPPEQIAKLRASLREFGQPRSIVVQDAGDDTYVIVAGHGITQAARLEEWGEIRADVIPASWPPEKVKAYLAADNELAQQSDRDDVLLASLLQEVAEFSETLLLATGYTEDEYQELLDAVGAGESNVRVREVEKRPPPNMAWVLIGIPVVSYGRIAHLIEAVAQDPEAQVETSTSNHDEA